jgi:hypothetical protein
MTIAEVKGEDLVITVEGIDKLLAFKGHVTIPLAHIVRVEQDPGPLMPIRYSFFGIGTIFAGRIQTGTFTQEGEKSFWDVHDIRKAILITLKDDEYAKLVIEVENPEETINTIQERIA